MNRDRRWPLPMDRKELDDIPDVRDGLTRRQRVVLWTLHEAQRELNRETVPTVMLYGRVCERINMSEAEFQAVLRSLGVTGDAM